MPFGRRNDSRHEVADLGPAHCTPSCLVLDVLHGTNCGTLLDMKPSVQARLDRRSQMALERLVRRLGWSPSRVVREGVQLLAACYAGPSAQQVIGVGRFASGLPDLGSNKKHLRGFGR